MLELENILTLHRIQREAIENIEKLYIRFGYFSNRAYTPESLRYCQEGIALNKKRLKKVDRELKRRRFNKLNSFARLGF